MSRHLALLLLGLILALPGCAQLYALRGDVGQRADRWAEQKEYGKAIDTLEHVSKGHAHYRELRAELAAIRRQADAYVHTTLTRASQLEDENQWPKAEQLLATAQDRLPDDSRLQQARHELAKRREAYIREIHWRALISKGQWLTTITPLRQRIAAADPDSWTASRRLRATRDEAKDTGQALADAGQQALEQGQLDLAKQALVLADNLAPSAGVKTALTEIKKREQAQRRREAARKARERAAKAKHRRQALKHKVDRQIATYHRCYHDAEWTCARQALHKIRELEPHNGRLPDLEHQLDKSVHKRLAAGIERGRRLYSQGKIQAALDAWLPLRKLAPNNSELEGHIARARKVLHKLKELRAKAQEEKTTGADPNDPAPR